MSLENTINQDIKEAMKAKDSQKLAALRAVKSAILLAKTEKGGDQGLSNEQEIALLQRLVKQRKESYELYVAQNREDLAQEEKQQMEAIEVYLPAQLSDEALRAEIQTLIDNLGASGPCDMGKVMGQANQKLKGQAEGARIAQMVKELLNS